MAWAAWPKCLCSDVFSVWEWLGSGKMIILMEARPCIYTKNYGIRGKVRDNSESSERALDDSQGFPSVLKSLYDSLWVVLTHRKPFLATWGPQYQARGQVAMRMCWECILNRALLNPEGKLKLSKVTVLDDLVVLLRFKLILNKCVKARECKA